MLKTILTLALVALPTFAFAGEKLSGDQIKILVNGNTVQGSMLDTGAYSEFYAKDGTIKANGYTGKWSISENTMCFQYGADPATCWAVELEGDQVSWIKDGKKLGGGSVVEGNPNNY